MNWIDGELGPKCYCGEKTFVSFDDNKAFLMCLFHTSQEAAFFPLPNNKPEKFPNMSNKEMEELIYCGMEEQEK